MAFTRPLLFSLFLAGTLFITSCSVSDDSSTAGENTETDNEAGDPDNFNDNISPDNDNGDSSPDNADTGDTADTGNSGDTGNTADTGDTADSGDSGDTGAYRQCDPSVSGSCPEGMNCIKGYDNAKYGQCLKPCTINEDCPPPPETSMQVACHTTEKVCLILCGSYEGECPDWLECFGQEMCLPPSSVTPTKGPGEKYSGKDECMGDSDCISGESGIGYCYPLCDPNVPDDCAIKAPGFQAQCTNAGGFSFCMFSCQGVPCPGELQCLSGVFCKG